MIGLLYILASCKQQQKSLRCPVHLCRKSKTVASKGKTSAQLGNSIVKHELVVGTRGDGGSRQGRRSRKRPSNRAQRVSRLSEFSHTLSVCDRGFWMSIWPAHETSNPACFNVSTGLVALIWPVRLSRGERVGSSADEFGRAGFSVAPESGSVLQPCEVVTMKAPYSYRDGDVRRDGLKIFLYGAHDPAVPARNCRSRRVHDGRHSNS